MKQYYIKIFGGRRYYYDIIINEDLVMYRTDLNSRKKAAGWVLNELYTIIINGIIGDEVKYRCKKHNLPNTLIKKMKSKLFKEDI